MNEARHTNLIMPGTMGTITSAAASGGGEVTYVSLRPPVGELWIMLLASLLHDDTSSRICAWYGYDTATYKAFYVTPAAIAANVYVPLYTNVGLPGRPLVLNYDRYLVAGIVGATAGKKVSINYWLEKFRGVEPWLNE
jgi:hypothetical protein